MLAARWQALRPSPPLISSADFLMGRGPAVSAVVYTTAHMWAVVLLGAAGAFAAGSASKSRKQRFSGLEAFSSTAAQDHSESAAIDGNYKTYFQSTPEVKPWWSGRFREQDQSTIVVHSVLITLPSDPSFDPSSMRGVSVRVGNDSPSAGDNPGKLNSLCTNVQGQLATGRGKTVRVKCKHGPVAGRFVTIHIRSSPGRRRILALNTLSLAQVLVSGTAAPPSYVIAVDGQTAASQPYPRSVNSKSISISVGSGSNQKTYSFTVDTGSSILELSCNTPQSLQNCASVPTDGNYVLSTANIISTPAVCNATGVGCLLPNSQCFYTQGLTGGTGVNLLKGVFAQDTVSVNRVLSSQPISFGAIFACAEVTGECREGDTACISKEETCPVEVPASLFSGGCPGNNKGIESGWTFSLGGAASAASLPQQMFDRGMITEKVTGVCWQRPQKDFDCAADLTPNSAVALGPALPLAISSQSALTTAPLYFAMGIANGTAAPKTQTFKSHAVGTSVPKYGSSQPWVGNWTNAKPMGVLWDTGAFAQSIVPSNVFKAFYNYYTKASTQVKVANPSLSIQACNASTTCGANIPTGANSEYACQSVSLPAGASASEVASARTTLLSMYPPTIDIALDNGAVAQLPTAFALNTCSGAGFTQLQSVAVCSYVRAPPSNSGGQYYWLAGPWFNGRFVQFDASGPMTGFPASTGTINFSDLIPNCTFAA